MLIASNTGGIDPSPEGLRMRIAKLLTVLALAVGLLLPNAPAEAFGDRTPDGWGRTRDIHHYVYRPRYRHHYHFHPVTDPYAYRYEPRGYYPYYASHYWVPTRVLVHRKNCRLHPASRHCYKYYAAWGYPKRKWRHKAWHYKKYGGHRRSHW
jgi:hypothetical protein